MQLKLMDTFMIDACREMHPEAKFDVEAVGLESLKYRKLALLKMNAGIDSKEDAELYYLLDRLKDSMIESYLNSNQKRG